MKVLLERVLRSNESFDAKRKQFEALFLLQQLGKQGK
jgi:hypothetical protein